MKAGKITSATFVNPSYGSVTISANAISNLVGSHYTVTPSGGAGNSDTLTTINFTSLQDGQLLALRAGNAGDSITITSL